MKNVRLSSSQSHLWHPQYRPDIDGLRALAVLAVVAFHAFPRWVRGGFIGVDVFFVISGYLISTIIFESLDKGTFSFAEFYARRIKRIFPALILVLVACFAFGWFALLADEYKQLGKHIAAGAGFVSNIVFWNESGYFDNSADTKPLLHLWSLGIEEQFYIIWPLLLWLGWKTRFNLFTTTLLIATVSYVLNVNGVNPEPVATFYSPHTRFWELLSGSLLAWMTLYQKDAFSNLKAKLDGYLALAVYREKPVADGKTLSDALSVAGLLLLAYGLWRINSKVSFPGKWALVPVTGAVLVISAGSKSFVNRTLLSNRLAVWFGLISYPLYLWHWPLLSFARIIESEFPSRNIRIAAVMLSIVLAWLTFTLVEQPIRLGKHGKSRVVVLALLMCVVGCVGYGTYEKDGLDFREHATLGGLEGDIGHLQYHKYTAETYYLCTPETIAKEALHWGRFTRCMQSKSNPNVDIALVGDSHAEHLFLGIAEALPDKNVAFYVKASPPFLDNPEFAHIFNNIVTSKTIKSVIVTMFWGLRFKEFPAGSSTAAELLRVIDALNKAGKTVSLASDVPSFPFTPDKCKGKRWGASKYPSCEMDAEARRRGALAYSATFNEVVAKRPAVKVLDIEKYLCDGGRCRMNKDGMILYRDNSHLNINGSLFVGRKLVEDNPDAFR